MILRQFAPTVLLAVCVCTTAPACAGHIFLSGDSNIGNAIDGSSGAPVNGNNATWFTNILDDGTQVRIQNTRGASSGNSVDAVHNHYTSLVGVTSHFLSGTILPSELSGVDLLICVMPDDDYTADEISAFSSLLANGGSLFFWGTNSTTGNLQAINARINAALAALGSSMALAEAEIDDGFHTTANIDGEPLNIGVSSFTYAFTTAVVGGGTPLIRTVTDSGAIPFIVYETIPEPTTLALAAMGLMSIGCCRRRRA